jgi:hypothetical protein
MTKPDPIRPRLGQLTPAWWYKRRPVRPTPTPVPLSQERAYPLMYVLERSIGKPNWRANMARFNRLHRHLTNRYFDYSHRRWKRELAS